MVYSKVRSIVSINWFDTSRDANSFVASVMSSARTAEVNTQSVNEIIVWMCVHSMIGSLSLPSGLLPRVKGDVGPLTTVPTDRKPDPWRPKDALFGQNDYIDILGDGSVSVTQMMTSTPYWLKKFRGNEMQMLIRKRTAFQYWQWCRPKKWEQLNLRIDRLYRKLNYKTKPPKPRYPWNYLYILNLISTKLMHHTVN